MQQRIKDTGNELLIVFVIGGLIGSLVSWASNSYVAGVQFFTDLRESTHFLQTNFGHLSLEFTSLIFLWIAGLLVITIRKVFGVTRWHGPADTIFSAQQTKVPLDIKHGIASTLAAFTSAAGGGSVGQYGPLVHFGATLGVALKKLVVSRLSNDIYLGCGVAAAISAGFGAPLAGIVFAHEAVLRHFSVRAIAPISVASIAAFAVSEVFFHKNATFIITSTPPELFTLIPELIVASPFIALAAILYMQALRSSASFAAKSGWSPQRLIMTAATVCGAVGIFLPEILGLGIGTINSMLAGNYSLLMLVLLLFAKIAMTALCVGFGLFGGVFSPALFIGVATGGAIASAATLLGAPDMAVAMSIAAMAAVAANVVGAPIAVVLIVLELSQSYAFAVAALMAVMASWLITHRLFGHSFFDRQLLDRGIDLAQGREAIALAQNTLHQHISDDCVRLNQHTTGHQALIAMRDKEQTEAYILDDENQLIAKLSVHQALQAADQPVTTTADKTPILLKDNDSLQHAMKIVSHFVGESVPILKGNEKTFLGVITEGDLFKAVLDVQSRVRRKERD